MGKKEYERHRPSNVKWLGDIPEHWSINRLKYIAKTQFSGVDKHAVEDETPVKLCNYTDVYKNEYITSDLNFMEATAKMEEIRRFRIEEGDILATKDSETWNDIAVAAYVNARFDDVLCGYHLAQVRAKRDLAVGKYLFRAISARGINDQFRVEATGITRYGIGKYSFDNALFLVPPTEEQEAIAAFLDRETSRIDELIAKKERQIELLQEKRSALISHVVTKGLDPNVKMKDSGMEWLGDIPEGWTVLPLKRLAHIRYGLGQPPKETSDGLPLLRATNIKQGRICSEGLVFVDPSDISSSRDALLRENEIIVVRSGAYTGDSAIVKKKYVGAVAGYDLVVTVASGLSDYIAWQFLSPEIYGFQFQTVRLRAAQPHMNAEELGNTLVVSPPLCDQEMIVRFIDRETVHIDELLTKVNKSIDLLREYRTALVSAAVTGEIDVREEVS